MTGPDPTELEARYQAMSSLYASLKQACESRVTNWRWASHDIAGPRPLYHERHGWSPGRLLKQPPAKPSGKVEIGFDAEGQVHVEREYSELALDGKPFRTEVFTVRRPNAIDCYWYDAHPVMAPVNVGTGVLDDEGRVLAWRKQGSFGTVDEIYQWRDGRVVTIEEHVTRNEPGTVPPWTPHHLRYHVRYDDKGRLERIVRQVLDDRDATDADDGEGEVVYRSRSSTAALRRQLDELRPQLKASVLRLIAAAGVTEPVYAVALQWSPGQHECLPASVGIGLASERDAWVAAHGRTAHQFLWNPAEYRHLIYHHDEPLREACQEVNLDCWLAQSWTAPGRVMNELARELAAMDWTGLLKTTDDFVVYAIDIELSQLTRSLKFSMGAERVAQLRAKRWL